MKASSLAWLVAALALALVGCAERPMPTCSANGTSTAVSVTEVCNHLRAINCPITDCEGAYAEWQRTMDSMVFAAVTQCYQSANTCTEVDGCSRACLADAGP